jgi:hypothetical protein
MLFQPPPGPLQPPPEEPEPEEPEPEEPEQPARFQWNTPEFGHRVVRRDGRYESEWMFRLNDINGIECRAKLRDSFVGGPELAAEHSATNRAALLAQFKDEVAAETEHRAKHEARWAEILDLPQLFIAV